VRTEFGATLNAFSLDRSRPRTVFGWKEWGDRFPNMPVPPMPGETLVGSQIALFGCHPSMVLETIGAIEIAEGLPHPLIEGRWSKISPETGRSYLIAGFSEANVDTLLEVVEQAGLMTLYHDGPFETWGHFRLRPDQFPNGRDGMRRCVEKATARGIRIGAHTLTNFITPNDPFVTPKPDRRLAETGRGALAEAIDAVQTRIPVQDTLYFANEQANWLRCVRIEDELVQYPAVTREAPFELIDCTRGAFGTSAASHAGGEPVGKLLDHGYKVFFPTFELQEDLIRNLAEFFNATGVSQMDFDGHEGCYATGQGNFAMEHFAERFCALVDHTVVNGSSRSSHFYWHAGHYLNWGEPWYEGFRESMQQYRIDNQALLERNYLPNMLGWYLLTEHTTLADIEWMLARAAGYDAGFALATSIGAIRTNPELGSILDAIREWETARRLGGFKPQMREALKDPRREFHLAAVTGGWELFDYHKVSYENPLNDAGTGTGAPLLWAPPVSGYPLRFALRTGKDAGAILNPVLVIDDRFRARLPVRLAPGHSLACDGEANVRVYDEKGRHLESVPLPEGVVLLDDTAHSVQFSWELEEGVQPHITISFQSVDQPVFVPRPGEPPLAPSTQ